MYPKLWNDAWAVNLNIRTSATHNGTGPFKSTVEWSRWAFLCATQRCWNWAEPLLRHFQLVLDALVKCCSWMTVWILRARARLSYTRGTVMMDWRWRPELELQWPAAPRYRPSRLSMFTTQPCELKSKTISSLGWVTNSVFATKRPDTVVKVVICENVMFLSVLLTRQGCMSKPRKLPT